MKIIKLTFLFLFAIIIASCSDDDSNETPDPMNEETPENMDESSDETEDESASVIGMWEVTSIDASGTSTVEIAGQTIETEFLGEGIDLNYSVTFTEEPNEVTADGDYNIELTTTIAGQSITEVIPGILFIDSGDWVIDGDQITISSNDMESTGTITTLNETTLVIEITDAEFVIEQQGIETTAVVNASVSLERL
ncbi:lipocalin family protein [uncultured Dokdonia sp.]|uniref:lipocalin family protein n=1 Tax=uncultured Dokdonia sp. TaxID=575653 RepID=UPI0026216FBA|nr:lipocalin family protein [uncultured Dokdonia sp.]